MDKKEARSILGVSKDATKNDIEKKYAILLKKYRMEISRLKDTADESEEQEEAIDAAQITAEDTGAGEGPCTETAADTEPAADSQAAGPQEQLEAEFSRITEAYNVLMGYEIREKEESPGKAAPLFKMVGINEKKAKNFFYYYKFHILAAILLIVAAVYIVRGYVNRVVPDFNAAFVGRIGYYEATEALADSVRESIPIIGEPGFDGAYIDETINGDQLYAMEMKLTVLFGAADIDVFILDRQYYERFARQGLFKELDDIAPRLGVDVMENQELILAVENDLDDMDGTEGTGTDGASAEGTESDTAGEPHLYGIDVSNSTVLKEAGVIADDMIAAIYLGTEQQEKAEAFLRFLLN